MADEKPETGWLIEGTTVQGWPMWLCVVSKGWNWTCDSLKAIRFARAEDAEAVRSLLTLVWDTEAKVTEHIWG